jgi:hypothetical protein
MQNNFFSKIPKEKRKEIFNNCWKICELKAQNAFICGLAKTGFKEAKNIHETSEAMYEEVFIIYLLGESQSEVVRSISSKLSRFQMIG